MAFHSMIKDISVKVGDKKISDCNHVNHSVNIKNGLDIAIRMLKLQLQMNFFLFRRK